METAGPDKSGQAPTGAAAVWFVQTFAVLLLIWSALNGLEGFFAAVPAALAGAAIGTFLARGQPYPWRPLRWLAFAGFFLVESFKGGTDVAWRALHPANRIQPQFQRHAVQLPQGLPTTLLTSIVSLLPGTLSVRLSETEGVLTVHALTPAAMASVTRLERMLDWVFSEPPGAR